MDRNQFLEIARSYLDVPFVHQGRSREGVDCVGLVICVAREAGLIEPTYNYSRYSYAGDPSILISELDKLLIKKTVDHKSSCDLLVFSLPNFPCHTAIYCGGNRVIHALNTIGRVVEHRLNPAWIRKLCLCYSIPGLED